MSEVNSETSDLFIPRLVLPARVIEQSLKQSLSNARKLELVTAVAVSAGMMEYVLIDEQGNTDYFVSQPIRAKKYDIPYGKFAAHELVLMSGLLYEGVKRRSGLRQRHIECPPEEIQAKDKIVLTNTDGNVTHSFTTETVIGTGISQPWDAYEQQTVNEQPPELLFETNTPETTNFVSILKRIYTAGE
jgi:hypothetical protein